MHKFIHQVAFGALLASALWLLPSRALAQIKLPFYDPEEDSVRHREVVFEQATRLSDYRHGNLLQVIMGDGTKIEGTLVRVDAEREMLYIRRLPGTKPISIDLKKAKTVAKGLRQEKGSKNGIAPIGFGKETINNPEIQRIEITHGPTKTIHYLAPNLSPAERMRLVEMANAENNLMRAEEQGLYTAIIRQEEVNIRREQRNQQELLTQLLYRSLIAPAVLTTHYGYGQVPTDYALAMTLARPTDNGMLKTIQTETPTYLKQAQLTYTQLRTRAVYEDNRIVAVVAEE